MADSIVIFLLENLKQLLLQEANLLLGVEDEVKSLQDELKLMNSFLKSFMRNNSNQDIVDELVTQLRDVAHEAEDVIDTYVANVAQQRGENFLGKVSLKFVQLTTRREVSGRIESIRKKINQIHTNKEKYSIQNTEIGESSANELAQRRRSLPIAKETDVVGLEKDTEIIINHLTDKGPELHVVAIIGMGGLGKTTLAKKVYDDPLVQNHFSIRAWVCVSKDYKLTELLQAIIKCTMTFTEDMKEMSDEDLRMKLHRYLRNMKYLIVLDDVWKTECWDELYEIFAHNLQGSRIILTTRNTHVGLHVNSSTTLHYPQFLDEAESWDLLSKKVFQGGMCPPDLEDLGKKISKKCRGLPLAIVVVAGVLTKTEHKAHWWPKILARVSSLLTDNKEWYMDIIALSYDCLPHHLQWCFLYFAILPEDTEISARRLIQLWIAEGFVQQKDRVLVEEIAEEYLQELINRNLIQAVKLTFDGGVKACGIHDLLRDLCIVKSKQEKFLEVRGNENPSTPANSRRLAIHSNTLKYVFSKSSTSNVRSFLCFVIDDFHLSTKHWKLLFKSFPLLRVLDLWGIDLQNIPTEIEKLIHLKYLRLKSHTVKTMPSSICNLWYIQTLDLRIPLIDRPKIGIWKMKQLRHLYFSGQAVLPDPRDQDGILTNVQTLSSISPDSCTVRILSRLPELLKLSIHGDLQNSKELNNISVLSKLQTLKLERDRCCESLSSLDWVQIPANITKLTLSQTQLMKDPMEKLGRLTNLQVLQLCHDAYEGIDLYCTDGGFPQLKVLKLSNLGVANWKMSSKSMTSLRSVIISRCGNLTRFPLEMRYMSTLRDMEIRWPNAALVTDSRDVQKHIGKDRLKLTIYKSEGW